MADVTDPNIPQTEAEKAYQANLQAARKRLEAIEAAMGTPQTFASKPVMPSAPITPATPPAPVAPQAAAPIAPPPTPAPSVPARPVGFSLTDLKNPAQPKVPTITQQIPQQPVPDVAAIVAAHRSVSPLHDQQAPASVPNQLTTPAQLPRAENPLTKKEPPKAPDHLKPVTTPEAPRSLPSRLKPLLSAIIVFFVVLAAFKAPIFYYQVKYLFESPKTSQVTTTTANDIASTPTLTIPKINVSAPIVFSQSIEEADVQKALESGVVHYGNTANPGQAGNAVIFGHSSNDWDKPGNYKFIFVLLEKLAVGDTYTIDYKGIRYEYQVYDRKIVLATDVGVVAPTSEPTSTLITCWPTGTSQKRLVLHAKQVSPTPSATATASQSPTLKTVGPVLPGGDSNNGITGTVTTWIENIRSALKGEEIQVNGE